MFYSIHTKKHIQAKHIHTYIYRIYFDVETKGTSYVYNTHTHTHSHTDSHTNTPIHTPTRIANYLQNNEVIK